MSKNNVDAWYTPAAKVKKSEIKESTKEKPKFRRPGAGRRPLPYRSQIVRVPEPIIKEVLQLIIDFKVSLKQHKLTQLPDKPRK